jgi:hypothetical protein
MATRNPTTRSGIYAIRCLANGKVYVGSSAGIDARWSEHRYDLNAGRHHSPHLQNAWVKYGAAGFSLRGPRAGPAGPARRGRAAAHRRPQGVRPPPRLQRLPGRRLAIRRQELRRSPRPTGPGCTRRRPGPSTPPGSASSTPSRRSRISARPWPAPNAGRETVRAAKKKQVQTAETRAKRVRHPQGPHLQPRDHREDASGRRSGAAPSPTRRARKLSEARRKRTECQGEETNAKRASSLKGRKPSEACVEAVRERWRKWRQSREEGPIIG